MDAQSQSTLLSEPRTFFLKGDEKDVKQPRRVYHKGGGVTKILRVRKKKKYIHAILWWEYGYRDKYGTQAIGKESIVGDTRVLHPFNGLVMHLMWLVLFFFFQTRKAMPGRYITNTLDNWIEVDGEISNA